MTCFIRPTAGTPDASPLHGRPDPAFRRRDAGARICSTGCRVSSAAWIGSSTTVRICSNNVACMRTPRAKRAAVCFAIVDPQTSCAAFCRSCWMSRNSCRRTGSGRLSRYHRDHPYTLSVKAWIYRVDYEPAESTTGSVWRQLELARTHLVPGELSAHRVAAEAPSLFRGGLQGRVSLRFGQSANPQGCGSGIVPAAYQNFPARRTGPTASPWRCGEISDRHSLARPAAFS